LKYTFVSILGRNFELYILKYLKIKKLERKRFFAMIRISDYIAVIIIMSLTIPFIILINKFYLYAYFLVLFISLILLYKEKEHIKINLIKKSFFSILRYPIEAIVPFILLYSFGFELTLPVLLFFTASTSMLYYIPRFKLAGGLLTFYLMAYTLFLGKGILLGFVVATILRLSSILLFEIPILTINFFNKKSNLF
jgi:hypothetical protein